MALFDMIAFAMASDTKKAEFIRASMITSIQSVLNMLDPLIFDPLIFSDKTVHIIMNHFDEKQYELVLWKVTDCLEICLSEREKTRLGKLLLEAWQHAIAFQEMKSKNKEEAADVREERKKAVALCQEGKRRVQRSLDETSALQMMRKHVYELMDTLNERSFRQYRKVQDDIRNAYYIDALSKLSRSSSVVKVEHRLLLLIKAWKKLYEHNKYRVDYFEEFCREQAKGDSRALSVLLEVKRRDLKGCEEGIQIVEARYKCLVEAKGDEQPWWQFLANPDTKKTVPLQ